MKKLLFLSIFFSSPLFCPNFVFKILPLPEAAVKGVAKEKLPDGRVGGITFFYAGSEFRTNNSGDLSIPMLGGQPNEFQLVVAPETESVRIEDQTIDHIRLGRNCNDKNTAVFVLLSEKVMVQIAQESGPQGAKAEGAQDAPESKADSPKTEEQIKWTIKKDSLPSDRKLKNTAIVLRANFSDLEISLKKFSQTGQHVIFPDIFLIARSPEIDFGLLKDFGDGRSNVTEAIPNASVHADLERKAEEKSGKKDKILVRQVATGP
jgi:hypothetical protein